MCPMCLCGFYCDKTWYIDLKINYNAMFYSLHKEDNISEC
jgi:hypothetical protein